MVKTKEGKSMKFKGKMRKKQGITLISLVVTIIVLLILAGVTIAALTGENGILNRAAEAKEKTEEAQRKEESDLDYMDKYIDKVVNNESLVLNEGTVYPLDQNQFDTFDEWGNFQDSGKAEYSTDYTMNANKSIKLTKYANGTKDPAIGIPIQLDLSNAENIGFWIYIPYYESKVNYADMTLDIVLTSQSWVGTYNESQSIVHNLFAQEFSIGWNFINLNISQFNKAGEVDLSNIQNMMIRMRQTNTPIEHTIYLDSIVLDYKMKPTILLNYDSSNENLYDTIYPLLKERNFVGTAFLSNFSFGSNDSITKDQYQEMKDNGWDFGMYGGMNTDDGYILNTELGKNGNYDEQYKSLKAEKDLLEAQGITDLVSSACPNNSTSNTNIQVLNELGFKIVRATGNYYTYPYKELTQGMHFGIMNSNLDVAKEEIDKCIQTGYCLNIFTHGVYENNINDLYADKTIYTELLDYIKQKVDTGEVQVMTYRDFYEACSME